MSEGMVKITGLWENTGKDGSKYLGGTMGVAKVFIFKNNHKQKENDPDYNLYVAKKQERNRDSGGESGSSPF